jgi:hypothetical protein
MKTREAQRIAKQAYRHFLYTGACSTSVGDYVAIIQDDCTGVVVVHFPTSLSRTSPVRKSWSN